MKSGVICSSDYAYDSHMNTVDKLKQCFIDVWHSLQQNVIDIATTEWKSDWEWARKQMDNILDIYCELVMRREKLWTNKMQFTLFILRKTLLCCQVCDFQGLNISQSKVHTSEVEN